MKLFRTIIIIGIGLGCACQIRLKIEDSRLNVKNFTAYYGENELDKISRFDLAILEPEHYHKTQIEKIKKSNTLTVAYLNIGEAESYRSFFNKVNSEWIIKENPDWERHYFIDVSQKGWQNLLIDEVIPAIFIKNFDGLFLDMIDVAELFPDSQEGMISIINKIRQKYPDKLLIMNNGLFLADHVSRSIDGILAENLFIKYDLKTNLARKSRKSEYQSKIKELIRLKQKYALRIFTLDYVTHEKSELAGYASGKARSFGFIPYVSTIALNKIFIEE